MIKKALIILILLNVQVLISQVKILNNFPVFDPGSTKGGKYYHASNVNGAQKQAISLFANKNSKSESISRDVYRRMTSNFFEVYTTSQTYSKKEVDSKTNEIDSKIDREISKLKNEITGLITNSLKRYDLNENTKLEIQNSLANSMREIIEKEVESRVESEIGAFQNCNSRRIIKEQRVFRNHRKTFEKMKKHFLLVLSIFALTSFVVQAQQPVNTLIQDLKKAWGISAEEMVEALKKQPERVYRSGNFEYKWRVGRTDYYELWNGKEPIRSLFNFSNTSQIKFGKRGENYTAKLGEIESSAFKVYRTDQTYSKWEIDSQNEKAAQVINNSLNNLELEIKELIQSSLKTFDLNKETKEELVEQLELKMNSFIKNNIEQQLEFQKEIWKEELINDTEFVGKLKAIIRE